jgi:pimeloyl-ACP methyl ester carboxylesterase
LSRSREVLTHRLEGEGEVVLLLNGGMMTMSAWEPVSSRLSRHCRLLLCDLRGQLLTPGESHHELAGHVDDVVALLDQLELEAVHVLGTSFGAEVGLLLAARQPDRVRSLAAVTATDYGGPGLMEGVADLRRILVDVLAGGDRRPFYDRLMAAAYSESYRKDHQEELQARGDQVVLLPESWFIGLEGILACLDGLDLRPELGGIRCPTLVVIAARDGIILPERSRALAVAIQRSEVEEHPASGHALVAEEPAWLTEKYLSFIRRYHEL